MDHLLKIKRRYKHLKRQNKLDKTFFQHDMTYGDFKDFPRRTASDKLLRNKSYKLSRINN